MRADAIVFLAPKVAIIAKSAKLVLREPTLFQPPMHPGARRSIFLSVLVSAAVSVIYCQKANIRFSATLAASAISFKYLLL
jgi:hypothetical protein